MDLGLAGARVLVTGAGRGIGLAIVRAFLAEGATVVGASRRATDETTALSEADDAFTFFEVDLSDPDGPAAMVDAFPGPIDVLVNNVGSAPVRPGGFGSIDDDTWERTIGLNLLAAVRACRAALPRLAERASILNIVSENAILADPQVLDYSAAKAALLSVTKSLSKELGPRGFRVNSISPGPVETALWLGEGGVAATLSKSQHIDAAAVRAGAESQMATGRFTRPEEVADLTVMLASPRLGNLTGADIVIDGGMRPTI